MQSGKEASYLVYLFKKRCTGYMYNIANESLLSGVYYNMYIYTNYYKPCYLNTVTVSLSKLTLAIWFFGHTTTFKLVKSTSGDISCT